jgi:hypothetical protein
MVWQRRHVELLPAEEAYVPLLVEGHVPGIAIRVLSRDEADGAITAVVRVPAGWRHGAGALACAVDLFVLEGDLTIGDARLGRHWYSYRPAGYPNGAVSSEGGATLLAMTYGPFALTDRPTASSDAIEALDVEAMPWGQPMTDKVDIGLFSKTLRRDPVTGERLFILRTNQALGDPRIEWHDVVEEIYGLVGTVVMDAPRGRFPLGPGDYCYRPPKIPHGPFQTSGESMALYRVSATLVNHYVEPEEAARMLGAYGPGLDPRLEYPLE